MKVVHLHTNHHCNPLGFALDPLTLSFQVEGARSTRQQAARIEIALDEAFSQPVFDSGKAAAISSLAYRPQMTLQPRTRYFWRVTVWGDLADEMATSDVAWFETGKLDERWSAQWITVADASAIAPRCHGQIPLSGKAIRRARAYVCGLGLYELYLDGRKVGDELLAPDCNVYDQWLQYQTYDLTDALLDVAASACSARISLLLGDGWYKGRFGFNRADARHHYGEHCVALAEIHIEYVDGTTSVSGTDGSWLSDDSALLENSLYDGEIQDWRHDSPLVACRLLDDATAQSLTARLAARLSPKVRGQSRHAVQACTALDDGGYLLDFGQNMVGWVEFSLAERRGTRVTLHYAEALQEDGQTLYRDNLRTAQARFQVITDGTLRVVRPHFTYFGFRYVRVDGLTRAPQPGQFTACFIYSDMAQAAQIETGHPLVNQFVDNVFRSQRGNFVDVPTDCPQRDERMGWTGDIQIFSGTACYNMEVYPFLAKYLHDLACEQQTMQGSVPFVVPMFDMQQAGSSGWGDAATVIPWNLWLHYGDSAIIERQYSSMKNWVDYISAQVARQDVSIFAPDNGLLWSSGFHFGDWLALDNEPNIRSFKGRTEDKFIASVYYMYSAELVAKAAALVQRSQEAAYYRELAGKIRQDIRQEYLTATGRLALDTQTGYILAIMFDLYSAAQLPRAAQDLQQRLKRDDFSIKTGFIGTPYFCLALSKAGLHELAYDLFLDTRCPGWLYPVTRGATSIWERWDAIHQDGAFNARHDMNSLNHYALGSVMEWVYRDVFGLRPDDTQPGFKSVTIAPRPDYRLGTATLQYRSAAGVYTVQWRLDPQGHLHVSVTIPFDCDAQLLLPDADAQQMAMTGDLIALQQGTSVAIELQAGAYQFSYQPTRDYIKRYGIGMSMKVLRVNPAIEQVLRQHIPDVMALPFLAMLENESVLDLSKKPFFSYDAAVLQSLDQALKQYVVGG